MGSVYITVQCAIHVSTLQLDVAGLAAASTSQTVAILVRS